ncbi:MAG: ShlB/FhaC/HecB family hemolysin secretion/activation protein [Thiobacillus sp.]|nr:ShlB/FhaC/HecB family hemolysin secretion/activation protein [Thiobacillus sp.]
MTTHSPRAAKRALALCLLIGCATQAQAQNEADILRAQQEAERIQQMEQQRQAREREEALQHRGPVQGIDPRMLMPDVKAPDLAPQCREIKVIVINGAPNLPSSVRERLVAPFLNRCLTTADFEKLLSAITRYYIERGFITTRAYIPRQNLSEGSLEILVVEGVVDKIMIRDGDRKSVSVANTLPGVVGSVLNLRDIEQGLDQINRLASNNASMEILPGDKPGTSTVVINNTPKSSWHLGLTYDNQGSKGTGQEQTSATIGGDNLLGFNDFASLTVRDHFPGSWDRHYSQSRSLNYVLPYGYNTWSMGASYSKYLSTLSTPSGLKLPSEGNSTHIFTKLERVVYRDQTSRATLSATLTTKETENYLANQLLQVSSRDLTVLDIDINYTTGLGGGVIGLDLGYALGLSILGALRDTDGMRDFMPRAQFHKLKYGATYTLPFKVRGRDAAWSSQLTGQYAYDVLYGSEQMLIGGIYTVRGFVDNILSGDNGLYWRNDLSLRMPTSTFNRTGELKPYVSLDLGRVTQRISGSAPGGTLSGFTVGALWQVGAVTLELSNSRPLTLPNWMTRESDVTYFRLSLNI